MAASLAILSKYLSDWNLLQNALKTNFKKLAKRSEIKALVTNLFLDKQTTQSIVKRINNYK